MNSGAENNEYRIQRLDKDKLKDLEDLYKAVYGALPPVNYFHKKYDTAYTGAQYIGYIARNRQDVAVAYYGVMPCFIQYDNDTILSAQSGDTMTHPQYRYKGMFVELARITFELCREAGIRFVFGFPNQHSYYGFIHKLDWKMTETMECFIIPIGGLPLAVLSRRFGWLMAVYRKYSGFILKKYVLPQPGIPNSVMQDNGYGGVYRDDRYLNYKTYSDTKVIQIGSSKLWIKIRDHLIIGDLFLAEQDFDTTMDMIKKIAASLGLRKILFHVSPNTRLHGLFKARYRGGPSFPVIFKDLGSGIRFDKLKFTFADIDIF